MDKPICYSHIGKRPNHEDNFLINSLYLTSDLQKQMPDNRYCFASESAPSQVRLFAISDGMGGHNAGEVASLICVEKLLLAQRELQHYTSLDAAVSYLQTVIAEINNTVCEQSQKNADLKGMGATLVLFVLCGVKCAVLNIGDSRAYHYNNGSLVRITKDHTEGQRMLDLGLLTRKELFGFPARKNLNRYIGYRQNGYVLQADEYYPTLENGVILLCSDGISDFLSDTRIAEILSSESDLEIAGKQLIDEAIVSHKADNATVMLIPLRR
ncbi:MAG: protein phosphatase 2C domain-containing protein [Lachnospiraceae bacterium]|nr:protein phosphatase 2C domain-containing protein [Lachnospiraceae bacterium]